jgi:hypothetical protein
VPTRVQLPTAVARDAAATSVHKCLHTETTPLYFDVLTVFILHAY